MHPTELFTQREIAKATDMDEGYTSRVVAKLEEYGLILRDDSGAIRPRDPDLLLDAWLEEYDFKKHHILRGHVAARSGDALLRQLVDGLNRASVQHAASGLAAAWLIERFTGFRITTLYVADDLSSKMLSTLSFRENSRGGGDRAGRARG